jgi:hypothetical protein
MLMRSARTSIAFRRSLIVVSRSATIAITSFGTFRDAIA